MKRFFILTAILFLLPVHAFAVSLTEQIESAYKGIKDMKGDFTQKSFIKDLNQEQTFKGSFLIKFPSKMRYTYTGGSGDEIVVNNDQIIIYQKKEKQAVRSPFDRSTYGSAPVSLLRGFGDLEKEFTVAPMGANKLKLTPKSYMSGITHIELEGAEEGKFPVKGFTIFDSRGNRIEITVKDIVLNTGIKDKSFEFKTPPGVHIYDYKP
jgi:outer membrane lipoprotein-sorting protein